MRNINKINDLNSFILCYFNSAIELKIEGTNWEVGNFLLWK